MTATRWQTLVLVAVVTGGLAWTGLVVATRQGGTAPVVPWLVAAVIAVIAVVVLWMGRQVKEFLAGRKPDLNPIRAARTAVLAKAAGYTGALLAGWYGAHALVVLPDWAIVSMRAVVLSAAVAAVSAVVLGVVGLVVESMCKVPPPTDLPAGEDDGSVDPAT